MTLFVRFFYNIRENERLSTIYILHAEMHLNLDRFYGPFEMMSNTYAVYKRGTFTNYVDKKR